MSQLPILYTMDKTGKTRYWKVLVEDNVIIKRYGVLDGKEIETKTIVKTGKNIGKKNETTPCEQAFLQAKSLWTKQQDAGYIEDKEKLDGRVLMLPMLADKWETKNKHISEPFYVQPKLDGVRMMIGKIRGTIMMISRTGKCIKHLDHLKDEVKDKLKEGEFLDGENYSHNKTFEEITGLCRTLLDKSADGKDMTGIEFHVFDYVDITNLNMPFHERLDHLKRIVTPDMKHVKRVGTIKMESFDDINHTHQTYVDHGYEGIIIRDKKGLYTMGKRSSKLLKYKHFQSEEYEIVDATEATGKDKGTVVWTCVTPEGRQFNVRPEGTLAYRKRMFDERQTYINGKYKLTVKFQNLTVDGVPRFPVGISIRDYE